MIDSELEEERRLSVHLLGTVDFTDTLHWQKRLEYEVSGAPETSGVLVLCEHLPHLSLGRTACRTHIPDDDDRLTARNLPLSWVGRGGGLQCLAPGQVVGYAIVALMPAGLSAAGYVIKLTQVLHTVVSEIVPEVEIDHAKPGLLIRGRRVAQIGTAVRHGIASYGFTLNVQTDLELWRNLACEGDLAAMTSLQRECRAVVRPGAVRQRLIETFAAAFGFADTTVFQNHPDAPRISHRHARLASRRN